MRGAVGGHVATQFDGSFLDLLAVLGLMMLGLIVMSFVAAIVFALFQAMFEAIRYHPSSAAILTFGGLMTAAGVWIAF